MPQSGKQSDRMGLRADSVFGLCKASSAWKGLETEALVSLTLAYVAFCAYSPFPYLLAAYLFSVRLCQYYD